MNDGWPEREWFAVNAVERILLLANAANREHGEGRFDPRIREVKRYLSERLSQPHSVADMANRIHLSPARFAVLFKQETGITPMRHLENIRLARAQEMLLSTSEQVSAIARAVGFGNAFHFTARFHRRVGQSPNQYRKTPKSALLQTASI